MGTVTLDVKGTTLTVELCVTNNEKQKFFFFTPLFHTYFAVNDIKNIKVLGLTGLNYIDKMENKQVKLETHVDIGIGYEVDRIYKDVNDQQEIVLIDETKKKYTKMNIHRINFKDIVLWNPWIEKSKRMSDFDDEEYKKMVCIEPGSVVKPVTLQSGETYKCSQITIASVM